MKESDFAGNGCIYASAHRSRDEYPTFHVERRRKGVAISEAEFGTAHATAPDLSEGIRNVDLELVAAACRTLVFHV